MSALEEGTVAASQGFTPALGRSELTGAYDRTIRLWTREGKWRPMLVAQIAPRPGERILDVGCGTGSLVLLLKRAAPGAEVAGLDPGTDVLGIAASKLEGQGVRLFQGFARDAAQDERAGAYDKVVSSLVFHQTPLHEKRAGAAAMARAAKPGGEVHIADYGRQSGWLERALFSIVQTLDGRENTQPNADGVMDEVLREAGLEIIERRGVLTPTGRITLWRCRRPEFGGMAP